MSTVNANGIRFLRVNNDTNGNPRYVCHFTNLLTDTDEDKLKIDFAASLQRNPFMITELKYNTAIHRAKKIGGKKFHNKQYGGGIVFQSYNIEDTAKRIKELLTEH